MAAITVNCSNCKASLKMKDESKVGKKVLCPKCKKPFVVQSAAADDDDWGDLESDAAALPPRRGQAGAKSKAGGKKGAAKGKKGKKKSGGGVPIGLLIGGGVVALLLLVGVGLWAGGVFSSGSQPEQLAQNDPPTTPDASPSGTTPETPPVDANVPTTPSTPESDEGTPATPDTTPDTTPMTTGPEAGHGELPRPANNAGEVDGLLGEPDGPDVIVFTPDEFKPPKKSDTAWAGTEEEAMAILNDNGVTRLERVMQAMSYHEGVHKSPIPETTNTVAYKDGVPQLSWRVFMLPFLDQKPLYDQFNLNEPWDSPHNMKLAEKMPDVYRTSDVEGNKTCIQLVTGPFEIASFEPGKRNHRISSYIDGTSNIISVVQVGADKAVPWTKPDDVVLDPANVWKSFGDVGDTMLCASMDGVVHALSKETPADMLAKMLTPAGGELVAIGDYTVPVNNEIPWLANPAKQGESLMAVYLADDCDAVITFRPQELTDSALAQQITTEFGRHQMLTNGRNWGDNPGNWEEAIFWMRKPTEQEAEEAKNGDDQRMPYIGGFAIRYRTVELARQYGPRGQDEQQHFYYYDDRTFIGATPHRLYHLLCDSKGSEDLREAVTDIPKTSGLFAAAINNEETKVLDRLKLFVPLLSREFGIEFLAGFVLQPFQYSTVATFSLDFKEGDFANVTAHCTDEEAVKSFIERVDLLLTTYGEPEKGGTGTALIKMIEHSTDGNIVTVRISGGPEHREALAAGLKPLADFLEIMARKTYDQRKLYEVYIGMHNIEGAYRGFPWNQNKKYRDKDGRLLLSWRVHLLPFVEGKPLYDQFHLDEPWDSPHNIKLAEQIPDAYKSFGVDDPKKTRIMAISGPGTLLNGNKDSRVDEMISRKPSDVILVLQAPPEKAVIWTKPDDLEYNPKAPLSSLGKIPPEGVLFNSAKRAGTITAKTTEEEFSKLATGK